MFARYYVKYLQAYARHGIQIDALTLLNEPGIDVVYPAMDISIDAAAETGRRDQARGAQRPG